MGRRYPTIATAVTALIAQACGLVTANHDAAPDNPPVAGSSGQSTGGSSSGSSNSSAGTLSLGGAVDLGMPEPCPIIDDLFQDQVVQQVGEQRVFYSWTTAEQVAELRAGTELFSRSERPGQGRGLLFTQLAGLAATETSSTQALADALVNKIFAKARFAWPNPWATLMGFPGETYGDQLLQIELLPDAWIAHFEKGVITVVDAKNQQIPLEMALVTPERIGAIYYQSPPDENSPYCGSFSQGAVGFREFALGNIDMVARWSLATPEIAERLESDIAELKLFEQQLGCAAVSRNWSSDIACEWSERTSPPGTFWNYDFALGIPSELYRPSAANIEALIAALEASMPQGEPLVVIPGK